MAYGSTAPDPISEKFRQWATLRAQSDLLTSRMNTLRDDLMSVVEAQGDRDDKGSYYYHLPAPVEVNGKPWAGIKREMRSKVSFNEDAALELLDAKGLAAEVVKMVRQVDQDEFLGLYQQGKLTQEEVDSCVEVTHNYAYKPQAA